MKYSWIELREIMLSAVAGEFSRKTSISEEDFFRVYIAGDPPVPTGDFVSQYIPDDDSLDGILGVLARRTGLEPSRVKSLFRSHESFAQFSERLLRSGGRIDGKGR